MAESKDFPSAASEDIPVQLTLERPARLRPGHLWVPARILTFVVWIGAAIMLAFGFIPGLFTPVESSLYDGQLPFNYSPIWPLLLGLAVGSGAAATGYVLTATGREPVRHHVLLAWCAGVATPLIPVLVLTIDRSWLAIPAALAWLGAAVMVIFFAHVRHRSPSPWLGFLLAALVTAPWLPAVYANLRFGLALHADPPTSESELLHLLIADISAATYVPGIALAFVAAMATGGVALAAHSRSAVAHRISQHHSGWRLTFLLCAVALVVIALEVSGVGGISSGFLDDYWGLGELWTWPHAILVASVMFWVTLRSFRTPVQQRGDVATTLAVGVSALSGHIVIAIAMAVNLVAGAVAGPMRDIVPVPAELGFVIAWLALAVLVPIAVRVRWRGTVGQAVARVGLLFLVPVYVGVMGQQAGIDWPVAFWSKAPQVAICLVVMGCGAALFGRTYLSAEMINRLVLIPLLIVSGTSWLPSLIATPLTPIIAVAAALFALLWAMPPVAADRNEHSGVVLTVSAQLLLIAAAGAVVTRLPDVAADDPTLALLLFSVPLSTLLCAKVT